MRWTLTLFLVVSVAACTTTQQPLVQPFADGNDWVLHRSLDFQIGESRMHIIVPAGFVTDFASVPRLFWTLFPKTGRYQTAAIVHDYLYWDQRCTRKESDRIFLAAMEAAGVGTVSRTAIYDAVRLGGETAWQANTRDRESGAARVIPKRYLDAIPGDATWADYQRYLAAQGVRSEAALTGKPAYCSYFD